MKITYGIMLTAAACMASGFLATGCAGPSTRVLPRESSSAYELSPEELPVLEEVNPFYLQEELEILTSSQRYSGSRGESDAARYIRQLLEDYGYEVKRQRFRYGNPDGTFVTGTNVEAVRRAPSEDADILIVTTHHDTAAGSPGAGENASGVVTWLETARLVSKLPTDTEIRFVSVSGSEDGWLGARYYVDSLTARERARVIGSIEIGALGYVSEDRIVLGTQDGKATMLGDMVKASVWDVLGETWQYEVRQQKNYLAFARGQMPSICIVQSRDAYEAGTPLDLPETVDLERVSQVVNVMTQTVSKIMSTDTPSMLAKSRYMNDLRDGAYVRMRDEEPGFGDTLKQTELRLGIAGRKQSENTDNAGRKIERYGYSMKWFDVDQQILTDYDYVNGKLETIRIDGDGAGVEPADMKERLISWYGAPESESEGPYGTEFQWKDPVHRIQAKLLPEAEGYEVQLQACRPELQRYGELAWQEETGAYEALDGQNGNPDTAGEKRMKLLLEKINHIYPKETAGSISRIVVCTDGIGAMDGYADRPGNDEQESEAKRRGTGTDDAEQRDGTEPWELYVDLEDMLTEDGSWRNETAADRLLVRLYGEILAGKNQNGIAQAFEQQFVPESDDAPAHAEAGRKPGEITESLQTLPDFADSFALFVLAEKPERQAGDWDRQIRFFYGYQELVAYRSQVRKHLKLQTSEDFMTE